jgi:hypothetical protein
MTFMNILAANSLLKQILSVIIRKYAPVACSYGTVRVADTQHGRLYVVYFYHTARRHVPERRELHANSCENGKAVRF